MSHAIPQSAPVPSASTTERLLTSAGSGFATAGKVASGFGMIAAIVFGLLFVLIGIGLIVLGIRQKNKPPPPPGVTIEFDPPSNSFLNDPNFATRHSKFSTTNTKVTKDDTGGGAILIGIILIVVALLVVGIAVAQYQMVKKSDWLAGAVGAGTLVNIVT